MGSALAMLDTSPSPKRSLSRPLQRRLSAQAAKRGSADAVLNLQRTAGNRAVTSVIQRCGSIPHDICPCSKDDDKDSSGSVQRTRNSGAPGLPAAVQRVVQGDIRTISISPTWTRALTDAEVVSQLAVIREHIATLAPDDPQRDGATANLNMMEAEMERRQAAQAVAGLQLGPHSERPPGLEDGGFALVELSNVPAAALDSIPEGRVTSVSTATLYGPALPPITASADFPLRSGGSAVRVAENIGFGAAGMVQGSGIHLSRFGFPGGAQGQYTIGIVVTPRSSPLDWGHTSLVLRRGNMPLQTIGFNPDMRTPTGLMEIAARYKGVETGARSVGGRSQTTPPC